MFFPLTSQNGLLWTLAKFGLEGGVKLRALPVAAPTTKSSPNITVLFFDSYLSPTNAKDWLSGDQLKFTPFTDPMRQATARGCRSPRFITTRSTSDIPDSGSRPAKLV